MTRITLAALSFVAISTAAFAQAPASAPVPAELEIALLAAPANMRDGATVIKWKPDYTYEVLRKGTNRLVCMDRSGQPGQPAFVSECTSIGNLERLAQNMKFEAEPDRAKRQAALDAAEKDGTRIKPEYGSVWYHVQGPSREQARNHMTVSVPGATTATTGLPDNNKMGGAWIMNAGTSTAHIMVPGQ